jgi:membrane protease YdiL (CAAX protease family)
MIPVYLIIIPVCYGLFKNLTYKPLPKNKFSAGQIIQAFFIAFAFMYIGNIIGTILNCFFSGLANVEPTNALQELLSTTDPIQTILVVVICAPIVEEFLFRKILIDRLHKYGDGVAIVISALVFGFYHGNITQFVYATLLGLVFGYVYAKSGNIKYSIGLHMVINFYGGFLSQFILEKSGYMEMAEKINENPEAASEIMMANIGGVMLYFGWLFLLFGFLITGIVLFFVNRKKLSFRPGEVTLEKGKKFSTIVINVGAMLFIIIWVFLFLLNMGLM